MQGPTRRDKSSTDRRMALLPQSAASAVGSSADKVVDYVTHGVLSGRLVPGQRLVEIDLTRAVAVSRGPVREALRRLEVAGIVCNSPHRGAQVRRLGRREAVDLLEAVEPIAVLLASLSARRVAACRTGTERASLVRELGPYGDQIEEDSALLARRRHFYDVLTVIGGNTQVSTILPIMRIQLLRQQVHSYLGRRDRQQHLRDYAGIAAAVSGGEVKAAERAMALHVRRMRAAIAALPDDAYADAVD